MYRTGSHCDLFTEKKYNFCIRQKIYFTDKAAEGLKNLDFDLLNQKN